MSSQPPGAGGHLNYQMPQWYQQMRQTNPAMPAPQAPQMPWAQQFKMQDGAPQQLPGLMANPSVFQFLQGMMQQPGGTGGLPGYGTPWAGGVPAYMQQYGNLRQPRDAPLGAEDSIPKFMDAFRRGGARTGGDGGPSLGRGKQGRDRDKSSPGSEATSEH